MLTPRRPELRGSCEQAARELAEEQPGLRVARGWYLDVLWGEQEHWWCVDAAGKILDPTVEQFPTGHLPELRSYREYAGVYPCPGCGAPVEEDSELRTADGFCCGTCYGETVGFPGYGVCRR